MMNTKELIDENDSRSNWKEHKHSANVWRPVCSVQKISNKFHFPRNMSVHAGAKQKTVAVKM